MVAKIASGKHIRGALSYNENKADRGQAECIQAVNYPVDHTALSFYDKLEMLTRQAELNDRIEHKCVHLSLNFHPSETFTNEQLSDIATTYMDRIGFGDQPYLVYRHKDAAHTHIHIVTTSIQPDGKSIRLHDLAKKKSNPARIAIEKEFGLVRAEEQKHQAANIPNPADIQKAVYGKAETKNTISNIVRAVYKYYRYTSLAEFNAVLQQFNIHADRGEPGTKMYEKEGLAYSIRDENGEQIGNAIKASSIYDSPTIKNLKKKFDKNDRERQNYKGRILRVLDDILRKNPTLDELKNETKKYGVHILLRTSSDNRIYGITYIDNITRCVFNGNDLGKKYSAKNILQTINNNHNIPHPPNNKNTNHTIKHKKTNLPIENITITDSDQYLKNIIEDLLSPELANDYLSSELLKEAKKKARRRRR